MLAESIEDELIIHPSHMRHSYFVKYLPWIQAFYRLQSGLEGMTKNEHWCASCKLLNELLYKHSEWNRKIHTPQFHLLHRVITIYLFLVPAKCNLCNHTHFTFSISQKECGCNHIKGTLFRVRFQWLWARSSSKKLRESRKVQRVETKWNLWVVALTMQYHSKDDIW